MSDLEWDGRELQALSRDLSGMGTKVPEVVIKAVEEGGKRTAVRARKLAPKRSRKMARTIKSTTVVRKLGTEVDVEIGPSKFYGRFLEHGTAKMTAKPYLAPAIDAEEQQIERDIAKAIEEAL